MANKVAILGKLSTWEKAPFNDERWDIWTLNYPAVTIPRITLLFDLHSTGANPNADLTRDNFPFRECERLVGGQYFNNTLSYMIAYAVLKGYKEIALYGARFTSNDEERNLQRHNCRELIFFARGRGIKVTAPFDYPLIEEYKPYGI